MGKVAIIGDSFSALFTAYELAKKGEEILIPNGGELDRIVRVGTHYNQEEIQKRLKSHFTTTNSVFREDVKKLL